MYVCVVLVIIEMHNCVLFSIFFNKYSDFLMWTLKKLREIFL